LTEGETVKHGYIIFMPKYAKIDSPLKIIGTFSEREKNGIPCYYHEETHTHYAKNGVIKEELKQCQE
jgi:hypothetical protein